MKLKTSTKISDQGREFLHKVSLNCIKMDTETREISYSEVIERIESYFKLNNDKYLEMVKMGVKQNA